MMGNQNYGGNYTYNLNGGTLQVPQIGCTPNNGYSTATFNFNGGVLKATGNQGASSSTSLVWGTASFKSKAEGLLLTTAASASASART